MPDISMCQDTECPDRLKCRRYTAKASEFQSYTDSVRDPGQSRCMLFLLAPDRVPIKSLEAAR